MFGSNKKYSPILSQMGLFLICLFIAYTPITDTDIWWHLSCGRWMVEHLEILQFDPFLYTPNRFEHWINGHWLFQLFIFQIHHLLGLWGLIAFKLIGFSVSFFIAFLAYDLHKKNWIWILPIFAFLLRYEILERPTICSLFFISSLIWIWEKKFKTSFCLKSIYVVIVVVIQILWVNTQGLYYLGIIISLYYALGYFFSTHNKALFAVPLLQFLACLISPNPLKTLTYPWQLLVRIIPGTHSPFSQGISENTPLWDLNWQSHSQILILFSITTILFLFKLIKINKLTLIYSTLFFVIALIAERNLILLILVVLPLTLQYYSHIHIPKPMQLLLIGSLMFAHIQDIQHYPSLTISPYRIPLQASLWLKDHHTLHHLYNVDRHGSYLIWQNPQFQVMTDGRFYLKSAEFFNDYQNTWNDPTAFELWCQKFAIDQVLLPHQNWPQFSLLLNHLYHSKEWTITYLDPENIIFERQTKIPFIYFKKSL